MKGNYVFSSVRNAPMEDQGSFNRKLPAEIL
jgi:hypothetical protein